MHYRSAYAPLSIRNKARHMLGAAVLSAATLCSAEALAEGEGWEPDTHRSGAGGEIYSWSSDLGLHSGFIGFANIGVTEEFYVDVFLPVALGVDTPGLVSERAGMGNPGAAFRYAPTNDIVRWWIGGGLAAPLNAVDDVDWQIETGFALSAMGGYQSYLWAPDSFPLFATGGADIRVHEYVSIQASLEPIVHIAVDDTRFRDAAELVLQNRVGAEFRHTETGLGGGLHFKPVWWATADGDNFQMSLEPHFAYTGETFFVRFGLLFALDRPLGPAFDDGKVFSQHAILGGSW